MWQSHALPDDGDTYERGGTLPFLDRVKSSVSDKCRKYETIITQHSLRFIAPVNLYFLTCVTLKECYENAAEVGTTFKDNPCQWGILFFTEHRLGFRIAGQPDGFLFLGADSSHETLQG